MNVAEKYIAGVLDGSVLAGSWIIKAFQRHQRDLENGAERGLCFDPAAGQFVIDFIQEFCTTAVKGVVAPMVLMPWQQAVLYILYGWKRANGTRRFRRAYLEIAKKNGKTGLAAALSIYHLIADGENQARVYIAATTGKQARECFNEAVAMVSRNPELKAAIHASGKEPVLALWTDQLDSLKTMARDGASEDGAQVSAAVLDELHHWKTETDIWAVLRYGGRTRTQQMLLGITTAGASAGGTSLCWTEHEYGCKVLDQIEDNDEFAPFIFSLDKKDNWKDSKTWIKANPSLGYLFDLETIVNEFQETEGKPTDRGKFKRFALNIWTSESEDPAIEIEKWDLCSRVDLSKYPDSMRLFLDSVAELKGRTCFAGLDLAPKLDTSSLVLLFPPMKPGEKWRVLVYFWCPKDNVADRVKRDRVPYDVWSEKGHIVLTPGNLTDVRFIADQITELSKHFDLKEIAYDEAWSSELVRMLGEGGFDMNKFVPFPQSFLRMNGPCQELMRKILREEFAHDHNPVMRWQMANLRWNTQKGTGFIKPDRDRKREKIDGPASLIMALARATDPENIIKPKKPMWVVSG